MTSLSQALLDALNNLASWPVAPKDQFSRVLPCVADSVRQLFVDPVNGSDENGGESNTDALQTIQEGVLRFKSPFRVPVWVSGEDRTLTVIHTAGMTAIAESVIVPPHAGEGVLRIRGQPVTSASGLTQNGALAQVNTADVRQTLTFVGGVLVAGALDKLAFCIPDSPSAEILSQLPENLPILTNLAGSAEVIAAAPSSFTAFDWVNGTNFSIVQPQTQWGPGTSTDGVDSATITNMGGALMVEDFEFVYPGAFGSNHMVLVNYQPGADASFKGTAQIVRCRTVSGFSGGLAAGFNVSVNVIGQALRAFKTGRGQCVNSILSPILSIASVEQFNLLCLGLFFDAGATARDLIVARSKLENAFLEIDGASCNMEDTWAQFNGLSIFNAGAAPALLVEKRSYAEFATAANIIGSAGNTNFGCLVDTLSMVNVPGGGGAVALSGTSGNLQVGAGAGASTWGGGAVQSVAGRNATYSG